MKIVSASLDYTVKIWNADNGYVIHTLTGYTDLVHSIAFSPDGLRIVSGGDDRTIKIWDTDTGSLIRALEGHAKSITNIALFS